MHFLLLLFLLPACAPEQWERVPWVGSAVNALLLTWLSTAIVVALAAILSSRTCRALASDPGNRYAILRRYSRFRLAHLLLLLLVYLGCVFGLGWGWAVQTLICAPLAQATNG